MEVFMVDQIVDRRTVAIPGPIGDVTPEARQARDEARAARDEAQKARDDALNAAEKGVQDGTVARLIRSKESLTWRALHGGVCLWIGDSFTQGYMASNPSKRYSKLVSDAMGWQEVNYAVGGSGYLAGGELGRNYQQQATLARDNGVTPDIIIVAGCQNDYDAPTYVAAIKCFAFCQSAWPDARVVCIPSLWCAKPVPNYLLDRDYDAARAALESGVQVIGHGYQWLYGDTSLTDDQGGMHPNDAGYAVISRYVVQGLLGASTDVSYARLPTTVAAKYKDNLLHLSVADSIVSFSGWLDTKDGSSATYNDTVCTIDRRAAPSKELYVVFATNGGNSFLLGKINPNGVVQLASWPQGVSSRQVIIPPTTWRVGQ